MIWLAGIGTVISSVFIIAANSWMQNPVGSTYNPVTDRAEMTNFLALLTNPVFLATFPHTLAAAYLTVGGFILAVAGWHLARLNKASLTTQDTKDVDAYRWAAKFGAWMMIIAGAVVAITGHAQGTIMVEVQPMKMAAAEALYETEGGPGKPPAEFSIFTIGSLDGSKEIFSLKVPYVLGLLAKNDPFAEVQGINPLKDAYASGQLVNPNNELQQAYAAKLKTVGIDNYAPNVPVSYWTFRIMIGLGMVGMAIGAYALWVLKKGAPKMTGTWQALMWAAPLVGLFGNSFGWIFTEMGRQPWLVAGVLPTAAGVSPGVTAFEVGLSMVLYTLLYGALAVVELGLMAKYVKAGLPAEVPAVEIKGEDDVLSFAY